MQQKQLNFRMNALLDKDIKIVVDKQRLKQIYLNVLCHLISRASFSNSITTRVSLQQGKTNIKKKNSRGKHSDEVQYGANPNNSQDSEALCGLQIEVTRFSDDTDQTDETNLSGQQTALESPSIHHIENGSESDQRLRFASTLCRKLGGVIKQKRLKKSLHTITIHLNVGVERGWINEKGLKEVYEANELSLNSKLAGASSNRNTQEDYVYFNNR